MMMYLTEKRCLDVVAVMIGTGSRLCRVSAMLQDARRIRSDAAITLQANPQ